MIGIKPGYKQTDVGLIPEDWEVDFLLNKVSLIHGKAHEKAICDDGNYIVVNSKFISSEAKVKKYSKDNFCKAKIGDVLMVLSDLPNGKALAKCFHVEENEVYAVNQRVCIYRSKVIESKYLYYVLNRKRSFLDLDDGVTQTHILNGDIKKCIFQFPKIAEQKAISNVICDVEKLIEGLQKLIKKKCDMKIATMQQLLTARKRLPGFNDIWEELQIKEFTHCVAGGTPSTLIKEYWDGEIFWMSSGELNNKFIYNVSGRITDLGLKNSSTSMVPEKCVLIGLAGQGKTRGTAAINYVPLSTNQSIAAIFPTHKHCSLYLYYNLESRYSELRELSSGGGGRGGLNLSIINNLVIPFPGLKEQKAISQILYDIDKEIDLLEKRLAKALSLRTGMMQELLTGKTRLIKKNNHKDVFS